MQLKPK